MPLVRYSVGAVGGDLSCERALEAVSGRGYDTRRFLRSLGWPAVARYPLPMFYVRGRPNRPSAALAADADVGLNRRADAVPELG
jgi:hypothetical protein